MGSMALGFDTEGFPGWVGTVIPSGETERSGAPDPVQGGSEALKGSPDCGPLGQAHVPKGVAVKEAQYKANPRMG